MNKLCPLRHSEYGTKECEKDRCSLWDERGERCSFLTIAKVLSTYILNTEK